MLSRGYERGKTDKTLFIKNSCNDIILVQVYVDDIIFGSTNESLWVVCCYYAKRIWDVHDGGAQFLSRLAG